MKNSGITRRIDELGRIVVPKEMRYNLGIREGEPLEIFVSDNAIVIKKFSQMENIKDISQNICNIMSDAANIDIMISDREKVIATSNNLKNLIDIKLIEKHKKLIDERESYESKVKDTFYDINNYFIILPIITSNDSCGLIFVISSEENSVNLKFARIAQKLIVNKLDI